jgi:hypothetical protein
LEKVSDALFLWAMFFQFFFCDTSLSVACIQYGSANVERQEDQSSKQPQSATVLSSAKIPPSSSCNIHSATTGVSFSQSIQSSMFVLQYTPTTHPSVTGVSKVLGFSAKKVTQPGGDFL